jgi:acetyltransferase-like isoleucine patch superfamily enzyme
VNNIRAICIRACERLAFIVRIGFSYMRLKLSGADEFGKRPMISGRARLRLRGAASFGDRFVVHGLVAAVSIKVDRNATLLIGNDVYLNAGVSIAAFNDVRIGSNVLMAPYSSIIDDDRHQIEPGEPPRKGPTIVEDNVWVGRNVAILPGVTIGSGSAVGANSVVTRDIPPNAFAAGAPARVIRKLEIPDGWFRD